MTDEVKKFIEPLRISILKNTDHTQLPDSPLSAELKATYAEYRQAVRDMPTSAENADVDSVENVVWPVKPE